MAPIIYIVKPGEHNPELRYSLRSLSNIEHDGVYMIGGPSWVRNVKRIPFVETRGKWQNIDDSLKVASHTLDEYILMNDDMYIMQYIDPLPSYHRGLLGDHIRSRGGNPYEQGKKIAYDYLVEHGYDQPLDYEVHAPMLINSGDMLACFDKLGSVDPIGHMRSIYGNVNKIAAEWIDDVKYGLTRHYPVRPFLSTTAFSFKHGYVGDVVRVAFLNPCGYE